MVFCLFVYGFPNLDVSGSAESVAENQTMTVKAILKEDNLRMEKFATVMAIYLIIFRGDIDNLPFKIGYNLYAFAAAVMALFMTISVMLYMGMFPWEVSTDPEMFECNMVLFMACILFSATGIVYMKKSGVRPYE